MDECGDKAQHGLYDPRYEHDACGIGLLVNIKGEGSHKLVADAVSILESLTHRGGVGNEPDTGDGAGILIQIPDAFMRRVATIDDIALPEGRGRYGIAMAFMSPDEVRRDKTLAAFTGIVTREGLSVLGIRRVPVSKSCIGSTAAEVCPSIIQVFIGCPDTMEEADFERTLYIVSKLAHKEIRKPQHGADPYFYLSSCSCRTIVYKGMLLPGQLADFYLDLKDNELSSAIALVHSRFSTNTFPSWERAHPMHHIIHNGEINTIRGNVNWVKARESWMSSELFGDSLQSVFPVINEDGSDSAMLDDFLSLLMQSGYSLHEAVMMAIPEPWEENTGMDAAIRAMYEFKSFLVEPWDGPASIAFTDGRFAGATLDRNGLRPSRYYVTNDDMLILASEVGVLPIPEELIVRKDRLRPGRMLLIDTQEGRIIEDHELKATAASSRPYGTWLSENKIALDELPLSDEAASGLSDLIAEVERATAGEVWPQSQLAGLRRLERLTAVGNNGAQQGFPSLLQLQKTFGYSWEDLTLTLKSIAEESDDPLSSMGYDAPLAILSQRPQTLYNYFKQLFAQVTNPPIDAIREHLVTSSIVHLGSEGNLLQPQAENCRMICHDTPILSRDELQRIRTVALDGLKSITLPILFDAHRSGGLKQALENLFSAADTAIAHGYTIIILSDKGVDTAKAAIPALLAVAGLHHHLVRSKNRTRASIVIESGEPFEVHHHALLVGYGANAICPYLAYETVEALSDQGIINIEPSQAVKNYRKTLTNNIVKVMSKMGISTVRSYHGAQIFEVLGLSDDVVERYFTGTASRIGGASLSDIEHETLLRHQSAFDSVSGSRPLDSGGAYKWRHDGEYHLFNPESILYLQRACRSGDYSWFKKFSANINDRSKELKNIRALLDIVTVEKPIPLESVEPVENIVKRFKTGAMSFGSISQEAHECMAIAMNRLGGKSNTGEGGESSLRYATTGDDSNSCSAIKQVASGRFGVTIEYLNNATEIQIKMAQGAKPGEGGHLPGRKVYPWVAANRYSTPGVELISPPPHHDIYSIEDLAQLIHDLKNANRDARVNVKLVSEAGVGTIAVGVAKGLADVIVVSGYDGGTGAASRTSIRHAGLPWELGVAETHQSLLANRLRDRVTLETDGKLLTGRDIVIAALLGAEEFSFATAPLIAMGCDMMRVCNCDTCPVGIATQNPELRSRFQGKPEHIINLMGFMAREVREWMARIGVRRFDDLVGHVELLRQTNSLKGKAGKVDLSRLLYQPRLETGSCDWHHTKTQDHNLDREYDLKTLLPLCSSALKNGKKVEYSLQISNRNRTFGTVLSSEIVRSYGAKGLPEDTIKLRLSGAGGQSLGAFLAPGITLELHGDSNDYLGKGLSGGKIIVTPPKGANYESAENIIVGNVAFYGATSGEAYLNGVAGERFCVRNSGVTAVVEGVGDHGCEYMTGGCVAILGRTGRNFAAGMTGGVAYVWDPEDNLEQNCNLKNLTLRTLTEADSQILQGMIRTHVKLTGSKRGQMILDDPEKQVARFKMLIPNDYQRIMEALETAKETGIEESERLLWAFNSVVLDKRISSRVSSE